VLTKGKVTVEIRHNMYGIKADQKSDYARVPAPQFRCRLRGSRPLKKEGKSLTQDCFVEDITEEKSR